MDPFLEFRERFHSLLAYIEEYYVKKLNLTELQHDLKMIESNVTYSNYFHFLTITANYRTAYMLQSEPPSDEFSTYFMDRVNTDFKILIEKLLKYQHTFTGGEEVIKNIFLDLEKWITDALYKEVNRYLNSIRAKKSIAVHVASKNAISQEDVDDTKLLFIFGPLFNKQNWPTFKWLDYIHRLFFVVAPNKNNLYLMGKHNYDENILSECSADVAPIILSLLNEIYKFITHHDADEHTPCSEVLIV